MRDREPPLTTLSASRVIGVAPDTVRWLVRTGRLRAIRTDSGQYLFERRDCERKLRLVAREEHHKPLPKTATPRPSRQDGQGVYAVRRGRRTTMHDCSPTNNHTDGRSPWLTVDQGFARAGKSPHDLWGMRQRPVAACACWRAPRHQIACRVDRRVAGSERPGGGAPMMRAELWAEDCANLELRIADLAVDRDAYRDIALAALDQLHVARERIVYLEQQADRLFDEPTASKSLTIARQS